MKDGIGAKRTYVLKLPAKRILLVLIIAGAPVLFVPAQPPPVTADVSVSLTVQQYSQISGLDPINVVVERKETSGSGSDLFTLDTNSITQLTATVTPPPQAPGVWGIAVNPSVLSPGSNQEAIVTITVSGLHPLGRTREWEDVQYSVMVLPGP